MQGDAYRASIRRVAHAVRDCLPRDIGRLFAEHSGMTRGDFFPVTPRKDGVIRAVDGSNATVMEAGSMAVVAARAGFSSFSGEKRLPGGQTPLLLLQAGPQDAEREFSHQYGECFGFPPRSPLRVDDTSRAAAAMRDTLEYWVASVCAGQQEKGGLLLLDGALRVSEESHDPVLVAIIRECQSRGVGLAAVSKRTAATWGERYPLLPAVRALSRDLGVTPPWWARIDEEILDRTRYSQWEHGDIFVCSLARGSALPLKIELPRGCDDVAAHAIFSLLSGCSDDARAEGYPYPLLDAHRNVVITADLLEQIRSDLLSGFAEEGLRAREIGELFGDYHDTFRRY